MEKYLHKRVRLPLFRYVMLHVLSLMVPWFLCSGSVCTKTRNTATPRNTGTFPNTMEHVNSRKTPVHRTKFDGVVLFSYYRPYKMRNVRVISLTMHVAQKSLGLLIK